MTTLHRMGRKARRLHRDERGAVLIWFTMMMLTIVSLISLALEGAAYMNLHSSMQEVADAAALSAAKELDGSKGAQTRASAKAQSTFLANAPAWSNIALSGSQIASVNFYSAPGVKTTKDSETAYVEVTTVRRGLATSFKQAVTDSDTAYASAQATAVSRYASCAPIQSFICNPFESLNTTSTGDGSSFLSGSGAKIGDMFKLVEGSGGASGDWGLIQPPGTKGNPNKNQPPWWAQSGTTSCAATNPGGDQVDTSPGNTAKFAVPGQNVRFDNPVSGLEDDSNAAAPIVISGYNSNGLADYKCARTVSATPQGPNPGKLKFTQTNACSSTKECTAEQTQQYKDYGTYCTNGYGSCPLPRDRSFKQMGTGKTFGSLLKGSGANLDDLKAYWANHHSGTLPNGVTTRYQIYQKEVDGTAAFTAASETREKSTPQCTKAKPAGGLERRLINVAIVDCNYWGITGRKTLPPTTLTARFFMTEPALSDGSIYGELVDVQQSNNSGSPVHHLVRLTK